MSQVASSASDNLSDVLLTLGFSQYESRCYVGLLGPGPQTGYAVSKATGVPQPKVYEALRKLVGRGAAQVLPGEPTRFVAVPPEQLFTDLTASFDQRTDAPRAARARLTVRPPRARASRVARLTGRDEALEAAAVMINESERRLYLSATADDLALLRSPVQAAVGRGVDIVVLCFGRMPFASRGMRVFRHASTDGALYRHHQARHVAIVADSRATLFALAPDGKGWSAIRTDSPLIIAAVKGYVRHDIDLQQIFGDFRAELTEAYGPGLQQLETYRANRGSEAGGSETGGTETGGTEAGGTEAGSTKAGGNERPHRAG